MLDAIKEYLGMKKNTDFAHFLGISSQAISNWYSRNTFDAELLYTKCLFLNADWLLSGEGSMLRTIKPEISSSPSLTASDSSFLLDLYKERESRLEKQAEEIGRLKARIDHLENKYQTDQPPAKGSARSCNALKSGVAGSGNVR